MCGEAGGRGDGGDGEWRAEDGRFIHGRQDVMNHGETCLGLFTLEHSIQE